ncbi:MAG: zinc-dependent metalloprotease [Flavipsychrobacter sp.]
MKKFLFPLLLLFISFISNAQVYTVPVVFHLRGSTSDAFWQQNTSDQALADLICDVNKIFAGTDDDLIANYSSIPSNYIPIIANTGIRFYIKGIDRPASRPLAGTNYCSADLGSFDVGALNIYLYDFSGGGTGVYLRPSGCKMKDAIFVSKGSFNKSGVAHEIGHALDLCHLDGCGIAGSGLSGTTCGGSDDCMGDTPSGSAMTSCNISDGVNMPQNVMQSYNTGCRMFFTNNQKTRMRNSYILYHSLTPPPTTYPFNWVVDPFYSYPLSLSMNNVPATFTNDNEGQTVAVTFSNCTDLSNITDVEWSVTGCPPGSSGAVASPFAFGTSPIGSSVFDWSFLFSAPYGASVGIYPNCILYVTFTIRYVWGSSIQRVIQFNNAPGNTHCYLCGPTDPNSKFGTTSVSNTASQVADDVLYPNPATNTININGSYNFFNISDLSGRSVSNGVLNSQSVDISDLSKGTYIIRLTGRSHSIQRLFVKE